MVGRGLDLRVARWEDRVKMSVVGEEQDGVIVGM